MSCRKDEGVAEKEAHFFDRWPLPTTKERSFSSKFPDPVPAGSVMIDGTPNYLFSSIAPLRVQAIVPHAKFVVILRVSVL